MAGNGLLRDRFEVYLRNFFWLRRRRIFGLLAFREPIGEDRRDAYCRHLRHLVRGFDLAMPCVKEQWHGALADKLLACGHGYTVTDFCDTSPSRFLGGFHHLQLAKSGVHGVHDHNRADPGLV